MYNDSSPDFPDLVCILHNPERSTCPLSDSYYKVLYVIYTNYLIENFQVDQIIIKANILFCLQDIGPSGVHSLIPTTIKYLIYHRNGNFILLLHIQAI